MYKCLECGAVFAIPIYTPAYMFDSASEDCPVCGGEDIEEVQESESLRHIA